MEKYLDRQHAGKILSKYLMTYANNPKVQVLALPRGGVPVAFEVAKRLNAPLDVCIVRKLGVPQHKELAMGAIATDGEPILNTDIIHDLHISPESIQLVLDIEKKELQRREHIYRQSLPVLHLKKKIIILVDDGIATGATMRAAIFVLKKKNPERIIIAVPVAAQTTITEISSLVDETICPLRPLGFHAVGAWYEDFTQTTDNDVARLLAKARQR